MMVSKTDDDLAWRVFELGGFEAVIAALEGRNDSESRYLRGRCFLCLGAYESARVEFAGADREVGAARAFSELFTQDDGFEERLSTVRRLEPFEGSFDAVLEVWRLFSDERFTECEAAATRLLSMGNNAGFTKGVIGLCKLKTRAQLGDDTDPVEDAGILRLLDAGRLYHVEISRELADEYLRLARYEDAERVLTEGVSVAGFSELFLNAGNFYSDVKDNVDLAERMYGLGLACGYSYCATNWAIMLGEEFSQFEDQRKALLTIGASQGDRRAVDILGAELSVEPSPESCEAGHDE